MRHIIQLHTDKAGDDVALASDGTTWWLNRGHWEPWADMLPQDDTEDETDD